MLQSPPVGVRRARREDFRPLAAMLARAFYDDPVTSWFYPNPRRRLARATRFFGIRLRQLADQDLIFTTEDHTGAALWTQPGRWREDLRQSLMLLPMLPVLLPHIRRSTRAVREIERRHPVVPHYYLSVLGTDPEQQGEGIGSALLTPVLDRCDVEGIAAYLESSKETNVDFYVRHGFTVTDRIVLPDGPSLWFMWREARSAAGRRAAS
ncbi:MAG TPA: GNAT family N-acetyltransferase [Solirubrobacteraceae bacterium]|jgi:ribosomal protein S18 acetylase RimI-like enzyme|nr:GNAT family N-acetyltransferase [Solirubrobacteraceae bacterium]